VRNDPVASPQREQAKPAGTLNARRARVLHATHRGDAEFFPTTAKASEATTPTRSSFLLPPPERVTHQSSRSFPFPHPSPISFGVAQWPSRKDEDVACVNGAVPGLFDAAVQLYDGHGGKHAARHCLKTLVPKIEDLFFTQKAHKRFVADRAALAKETGKDGFHPSFDQCVVNAFHVLDEEIKKHDESGTTAAVVFLKKGVDNPGDVYVKCAWVGDSRVVLTRDFDWQRTMDISEDHKPSSQSEVSRIRRHYDKLHGDDSFKTRDEVLATPEASVRGGAGARESNGSHSGSSKGNSRGNSQRGGVGGSPGNSRHGPGLGPQNGLPAVEMTLGHAFQIEEAVWGAMEDEVVVTTKNSPSRLRVSGGAAVAAARAVTESLVAVSVSDADLLDLRNLASRMPGTVDVAEAECETFDNFNDLVPSRSPSADLRDSRNLASCDPGSVDEGVAACETPDNVNGNADREPPDNFNFNNLVPSRSPSFASFVDSPRDEVLGMSRDDSTASLERANVDAFAKATSLATRVHDNTLTSSDDEAAREPPPPEFSRAAVSRMSFVGYYKSETGTALSKPRIYSSTGESHGVSRSIGDRGSARACVATPEIRNVVVPAGSGARIMACSDGVWDAFTSEKAARKVARYVTPEGAAKRMCAFARERAEYRGMYADDITAVVVDVGVNEGGGEQGCKCVVM